MRLSRFLIAGVLVPVVLGTNDATAEVCSGRFYVGVNVGAEFGKMKYSSQPGDQYDVVLDGSTITTIEEMEMGTTSDPITDNTSIALQSRVPVDVKLPRFPKKKSRFAGDVEVGYIFEMKNFGIGLSVGIGKSFSNSREIVKCRLLRYTSVKEVANLAPNIVPGGEGYGNAKMEEYASHRYIMEQKYNSAVRYNTKDVTEIKLKNKFNVTITPIIEYKANSMFGIYITGGIRISNDKVTYKETDGATKKVTNFKKTKTSIAPVVGGGVMINLSDHMYAKVQYLYQFGSKMKKTISRKINDKKNEVTPTVKYRSQKVTVGFGYMF